jgi:hypothetical protein
MLYGRSVDPGMTGMPNDQHLIFVLLPLQWSK